MVHTKIDRCANIPSQIPIPIMCNNNNDCIMEMLNTQKKNCDNKTNCNYNEIVLNRYLDTTYDKTKEIVNYSTFPSALTYIIPDEYFEDNYENDYTLMSKSFTDNTTIIIIILNSINYPTFDYTTVKDFKNYFNAEKKKDIQNILNEKSDICSLNHL